MHGSAAPRRIVAFAAGAVLSFSSFIENDSDHVLMFRNELEGGEMCKLWGITIGGSVSGMSP